MACSLKNYARFVWIITNSTFVIFVHLIYMMIVSPLFWFGGRRGRHLYWKVEEMFYGWILCILDFTLSSAKYKVIETGDRLDGDLNLENTKILFMPNHQSVADVLICLAVFVSRHGYAPSVTWIIGKNQKYTNFGLMSWLHDDCFLDTTKGNHSKALADLRIQLRNTFLRRDRKCLVLFPEGGFLSKKKSASIRFAQENKLPILQHCAYPRLGALQAIIDELVFGGNTDHSQLILLI